jgi:hypothetical protein
MIPTWDSIDPLSRIDRRNRVVAQGPATSTLGTRDLHKPDVEEQMLIGEGWVRMLLQNEHSRSRSVAGRTTSASAWIRFIGVLPQNLFHDTLLKPVVKTFKFAARPVASQRQTMAHWLVLCCWLYNNCLEQRISWWKRGKKSTGGTQAVPLSGDAWARALQSFGILRQSPGRTGSLDGHTYSWAIAKYSFNGAYSVESLLE